MTRNMWRAMPGLIAVGFFFVALILQTTSAGAVVMALLCLVACCYSMVALGTEADYWEGRSHEFYVAQQNMIDVGIVEYDDPILRSGRGVKK